MTYTRSSVAQAQGAARYSRIEGVAVCRSFVVAPRRERHGHGAAARACCGVDVEGTHAMAERRSVPFRLRDGGAKFGLRVERVTLREQHQIC